MRNWKQTLKPFAQIAVIIAAIGSPMFIIGVASAYTPTYTSNNYGIDQVSMSPGGLNNATSPSYQILASLGDTANGNSTDSNLYSLYGGYITPSDPYLQLNITSTNVALGDLSTSSTATTTATFTVRAYLCHGYVVVNGSPPPTATSGAGSHKLNNLTTPTASAVGSEQFGINLVADTLPASLNGPSASPLQVPSVAYSYGVAATGYNTTNVYQYKQGDTIADSTQTSGITQYVISYIFNISGATPAGYYVFNHVLIATATF